MNYVGEILKLFVILGILLVAMYLMLYFARKYLFSFDKAATGKLKIDILSTKGIAPKKTVSVLKIRNKIYVLGVSDNAITLIDKLDNEAYEIEENIDIPETKNFLSILKSNLRRK